MTEPSFEPGYVDGITCRQAAGLPAERCFTRDPRTRGRAGSGKSVYEVRVVIAEQAKTSRQAVDQFGCSVPFGAVAGQGQLVLCAARKCLGPCNVSQNQGCKHHNSAVWVDR